MKRLVYGVLRDPKAPVGRLPAGPEGSPVALLTEGELAAAFSVVPDVCAAPCLSHVQAYAQVVEALHQLSTILPMRYGCLLGTEAQIRELLRVRRADSLAALDELGGCMEMGLRVLLDEEDLAALPCRSVAATDAFALSPIHLGTSYLAERRACYTAKDSRRQQAAGASDRFRRIFAGLFAKCEAEPLFTASGTLLALHFLVRREDEEGFRAAFRRFQQDSPHKVLLTGPWPPYHFAAGCNTNGLP
jgi:hypothetical protein